MIRRLKSENHQAVKVYLEKDHINNVYIIHALEMYGLESKHAVYWGVFENSHLSGILYFEIVEGIRLGSLCGDDNKAIIQLGKKSLQQEIEVLVGKEDYFIPIIEKYPHKFKIEGRYDYFQITADKFKGSYNCPVKFACVDDVSMLVELYKNSELGQNMNKKRSVLETEIRRAMQYELGYFFIKQNGCATSAARIIAETDKYGVIDGSTTLPEYRGHGMFQIVRTSCFEFLFQKGKTGLGYFDENNPIVRAVVNKQGGTIIGKWLIVNMEKKPDIKISVKRKLRHLIYQIKLLFKDPHK